VRVVLYYTFRTVIASKDPENIYQTWNGKIGIKFQMAWARWQLRLRNGNRPRKQQIRFNDDLLGTNSLATHAEHALLAPNTFCKDFQEKIFGNEDRKWATRCRLSVRKDPENCPYWETLKTNLPNLDGLRSTNKDK